MNKEEFVARYGEEAYAKGLSRNRTWRVAHPEERAASHAVSNAEEFRKGGKYYNKTLVYNHTGLRGERNIVRHKHGTFGASTRTSLRLILNYNMNGFHKQRTIAVWRLLKRINTCTDLSM